MAFKISNKALYGIRIMVYLSKFYDDRLVTAKEISIEQDISEKYLEQILNQLNKSGFLHSVRGAYGGYKLKISPDEITVGMILRTLEVDLYPTICLNDNFICDDKDSCYTLFIWQQIKDSIDNVIDNITLTDVLKKAI